VEKKERKAPDRYSTELSVQGIGGFRLLRSLSCNWLTAPPSHTHPLHYLVRYLRSLLPSLELPNANPRAFTYSRPTPSPDFLLVTGRNLTRLSSNLDYYFQLAYCRSLNCIFSSPSFWPLNLIFPTLNLKEALRRNNRIQYRYMSPGALFLFPC